MSWKNANLSTLGHERHSPLQHNEKFIAKTNRRVDVYSCPDQPRRKSGEAQEPQISYGERTSYYRQVALVPIHKGSGSWGPEDAAANEVCHIAPFLNRRLRHTG
jgi:hypothetical protein